MIEGLGRIGCDLVASMVMSIIVGKILRVVMIVRSLNCLF